MNSNIVAKQVYEWIKTGHWSLAQFNEWLTEQEKAIHNIGYAAGLTWKERSQMIKFDFTLEDNEAEILLDVLNTEINTMTSEAKHSNSKAEYLDSSEGRANAKSAALWYEQHALLLTLIKQKLLGNQTRM